MDSLNGITQIAQLGTNGVLLVILYFLWQEYRTQNQFIRDQLVQSEAERKVLASAIGMTTQQLQIQAQAVRQRNLHSDQPN